MLKLTNSIGLIFRKFLPSPFSIAIILTFSTFILALLFTESSLNTILKDWEKRLMESKINDIYYPNDINACSWVCIGFN